MFNLNETVVYGSDGACKITEIKSMSFGGSAENEYYILSPISNPTSKIFVPCKNEFLVAKMQRILSAQEIKDMIKSATELPEWISDNRARNKLFKDILMSYDRAKILALTKLLYITKTEGREERRLYSADEELLKKTVKILHSEFSLVLNISTEEVIPFIFGEIDCEEK